MKTSGFGIGLRVSGLELLVGMNVLDGTEKELVTFLSQHQVLLGKVASCPYKFHPIAMI